MKALYSLDRNKAPYIEGTELPLKELDSRANSSALTIFSVPERDTIGTNMLDNAITLLRLDGNKVKFQRLKKDFLDYVYGGDMVFMPVFSNDTIGYSQTRGFLLFNIKNKTFTDYTIGRVLGITINNVVAVDAARKLFLFELFYNLGFNNNITVLKLLDLSTSEPKELASHDIDKPPMYAEFGKTTFYYTEDNGRLTLRILNEKLQPINHPLQPTYEPGVHGKYGLPLVHPSLPFAVFSENYPKATYGHLTRLASWRDTRVAPTILKLFDTNLSLGYRFSPDGKWFLFEDLTVEPRAFMVMPVDPNLPHYLGPPILLRSSETMPDEWNGNCAWISDPLSVVCSFVKRAKASKDLGPRYVHKLIKWDISAAAVRSRAGGK